MEILLEIGTIDGRDAEHEKLDGVHKTCIYTREEIIKILEGLFNGVKFKSFHMDIKISESSDPKKIRKFLEDNGFKKDNI